MASHIAAAFGDHLSEIHHVTDKRIYIRPLEPLPANVTAVMTNIGVYARLTDVADADLFLQVGTRVHFRAYVHKDNVAMASHISAAD